MVPWDVSFLNPELGLICETVLCWDTRLYLDILLQLGQLSRHQSQAWQPVCLRASHSLPLRMYPLGGWWTLGVGSALQEDRDARTLSWATLQLCSVKAPRVLGPKGSPERYMGVKMGRYSFLLQFRWAGSFACCFFTFFPEWIQSSSMHLYSLAWREKILFVWFRT